MFRQRPSGNTGDVFWRRRGPLGELPLDRDDVIAIFDALVEIRWRTVDIWTVIVGEEDEEETEP